MWTYVENELDKAYTKPLPNASYLQREDLPIAEFEVREALAAWLMERFVPANSLGWFDKIFDSQSYQNTQRDLDAADTILASLLIKPEYISALYRILSVMPENVPQKKYLTEKFLSK